jgi:hypothetical protein
MIANKRISTKTLSKNFKSTKAPVQFLALEHPQRNRPEPTRKIPCAQPMVCMMDDREPKPRRHRLPVAIRPSVTVRFTFKSLRWVIVVLFLYLVIGTVMMIEDGTDAMRTIVVYSVMGFATFFMAYFGWIVARDVLEQISKHRDASEDAIPEAQ